jgi:hypothetical protein
MDCVQFSQAIFNEMSAGVMDFLASLRMRCVCVPVSALGTGPLHSPVNVFAATADDTSASILMPWYSGPSLMESVDSILFASSNANLWCRVADGVRALTCSGGERTCSSAPLPFLPHGRRDMLFCHLHLHCMSQLCTRARPSLVTPQVF